jgi:ubiquinone/menaquinone biosynthesis C-methylase UbiE
MSRKSVRVHIYIILIRELGYKIKPNAVVLDLGCGNGAIVRGFKALAYEAFGCDFAFKEGPDVESLCGNGLIRLIEREPYRLPFADNTFHVVISDQVFEHVKNYDETLAEISRVLKPGGISLHFFPSRYTPIEPHVYVPLATIIQKRWWLAIWATFGVRAPHQKGMSVREVADANHAYLSSSTNYLSRSVIERCVSKYFEEYGFCESLFLKHSHRGRIIYKLSQVLPVLPWVYGVLRGRALFFRKLGLSLV